MDELLILVGLIGNIISVLVFLSPVKTFVRIVKHKCTEEFESFPYICTLLSACLWVYYGITRPDSFLVATVNAFGIFVEIVYISIFLLYAASPSKRRRTAIMLVVVDVGFLVAAVVPTYLMMNANGDAKIYAIGFMASILNVIMYASPLAAMKLVVTTKSVEYMPFLLSFFLFLNGGVWTFYAILAHDFFLGVPNGIGFMLGVVQLVLYAIYSTKSSNNLPHKDPLLPFSDEN